MPRIGELEPADAARGALVYTPFSCPNSSLSSSPVGIAAQLHGTNGPARRAPRACSARATSSFPVPVSPQIRYRRRRRRDGVELDQHVAQRRAASDDAVVGPLVESGRPGGHVHCLLSWISRPPAPAAPRCRRGSPLSTGQRTIGSARRGAPRAAPPDCSPIIRRTLSSISARDSTLFSGPSAAARVAGETASGVPACAPADAMQVREIPRRPTENRRLINAVTTFRHGEVKQPAVWCCCKDATAGGATRSALLPTGRHASHGVNRNPRKTARDLWRFRCSRA